MYVYLNNWKMARKITLNVSRKKLKWDMTEALQFLKIETEGFPSVQKWFFRQFVRSNQSRTIFLVGKL